jgi:hypothetical protein
MMMAEQFNFAVFLITELYIIIVLYILTSKYFPHCVFLHDLKQVGISLIEPNPATRACRFVALTFSNVCENRSPNLCLEPP